MFRGFVASSLRAAATLSFVCVFFTSYLMAQGARVFGSVSGTVTDSTGAAIAGARIGVAGVDSALVRTTVSGTDGGFAIGDLPSGTYAVGIIAAGFGAYRNASITVAVGRDVHVDAMLTPANATQQVTVAAQTEAMDAEQTSPVANIDKDRIEELPIPNRNYLSFTLLAPALAAANPAIGKQALAPNEGGFSSGGLRPSSNALYIDGMDDNDEYTGLSRTELSPEAISDFQVVNHGYAAQAGGSAGGSVDVVTRSGANLQHGDAFIFVQNGALNGTPALELAPRKPDETRLRVGLSTGGAIQKDKLFYYVAAEQEMAHGEDAGDFNPQMAAAIDSALAHSGPLGGFQLQQGFFPTTNEETDLSGRLDRSLGTSSLMLRYAMTNNRSVNDAFNLDDLTDLSARGSAFYDDNGVNGQWNDTLSPALVNQMSFQVAQRRVSLKTASTNGPGVAVAGIAQLGTPFAGNNRRYETHIDLSDDVILQHGKHLFEAGAAMSHVSLRAADMEGFGGLYVFANMAELAAGQPDFYIQSFGSPDTSFAELRGAAYVQDHWTPVHGLALDYGLRYEVNRLPGALPFDKDALSPRFGFAWSPDKDWVVRGGFGIFYDRYLLSTVNHIREFDGVHAEQQIAEGADAAALYQMGQRFIAPHAGIAPSIWQPQPGLANPYAETASLGVEHALGAQWTASAEYRYVRGVKMGRTINRNLPPPVVLTTANAPELGIPVPAPQQLGQLIFPEQRLNETYDDINQFQTEAGSDYNGLTATLNRQFTEEFELMAGYTLSKTLDDASYDTEQPQNPYALDKERAFSLGDQRQRFVVSGLWVLGPDLDDPQDVQRAAKPNVFQKVVYGFEFATTLAVGSGFRDNPVTGTDSNREHIYPFAARPAGFSRDSLKTPSNVNFDLRVLRMVPIWRGHLDIVAESFNLLNRQNVDLINPVHGLDSTPMAGFGTPVQMGDPRRIQISLDYEY